MPLQQPPPQLSQPLPPLHEQILKSLPVIPPCLLLDASKTDPITYEQVTQFAQEFFEEGELFCFPKHIINIFLVYEIGRVLFCINPILARMHPPICTWGYGNIRDYLQSCIRIITVGHNGSSYDPAFKNLSPTDYNFLDELDDRCMFQSKPPTKCQVKKLIEMANAYFNFPSYSAYFYNFLYVPHY